MLHVTTDRERIIRSVSFEALVTDAQEWWLETLEDWAELNNICAERSSYTERYVSITDPGA